MFCFQCEQTEGKGINIYTHGEIDEKKDFTPVIEKALELEEIGGLPVQSSLAYACTEFLCGEDDRDGAVGKAYYNVIY